MARQFLRCLLCVAAAMGAWPTLSHAEDAEHPRLLVTVKSEPRQTFGGLGLNVGRSIEPYKQVEPAVAQEAAERLFEEARFRHLRLWHFHRDREIDVKAYVDNPFIAEALKYDLGLLKLNCTGKGDPFVLAEENAGWLKELTGKGIPFNAAGYLNKPNTDESGTLRTDPDVLAQGIVAFRQHLDELGLAHVKICGPDTVEWFPRPSPEHAKKYNYQRGDTMRYFNAIIESPEALDAIDAFSVQTYGMGVTKELQELVRPYNKEFWVTTGAVDSIYGNRAYGGHFDPIVAPIVAAMCLSDLNHGVTHWFHWDIAQLIPYLFDEKALIATPRYRYLKSIGLRFDVGAVFRECVSSPARPTADMLWHDEHEPDIVAAAARNPDGSWTVAVVNTTGIHAQHYASRFEPEEATPYNVDVFIEELADVPQVAFTPWLSRDFGLYEGKPAEMIDGTISLWLRSRNMMILRSGPIHEP